MKTDDQTGAAAFGKTLYIKNTHSSRSRLSGDHRIIGGDDMNKNVIGLALILFGILLSMGMIVDLAFLWIAGLAVGLAGLLIILINEGKNNKS